MSWRPLVEVLPVLSAPNEGLSGGGQQQDSGQQAATFCGHTIDAGELTMLPNAGEALAGQAGQLAQPYRANWQAQSADEHGRAERAPPNSDLGEQSRPRLAHHQQGHDHDVKPLPFGNAAAHAEAAEQVREQAKHQGYQEGAALARAEQEALAMRYRGAIEDLVAAREQTIAACEADLVRLALTIAREVLQSDVPGREQFASSMASYALQALGGQAPVTLRMNSKDAAALRANKPELTGRADVQLIEDEQLAQGGVVATGGRGRFDASIETRIAELGAQLLASAGAA